MKIIIKNGHIIDPNSKIDNIQNLYIEGSSICLPFPEAEADVVIDASNRVVCPGFIDMHMHEDPVLPDGSIYADEEKAVFNCMLRMGVTTAIAGNCGENEYHPADYLDLVDAQGVAVNVGMLAGHEFFRNVAGGVDRYASISPQQVQQTARGMERPYKVWGGVHVILLTVACFLVLLVNNFVEDPVTSLKGLIIIAICIPMYFVFRKANGGKEYDTDLIDN